MSVSMTLTKIVKIILIMQKNKMADTNPIQRKIETTYSQWAKLPKKTV